MTNAMLFYKRMNKVGFLGQLLIKLHGLEIENLFPNQIVSIEYLVTAKG